MDAQLDIIFVGGGLANALIANRLLTKRPDARWVMLEKAPRLFGHHAEQTWSFHHTDLADDERWITALATHQWSGYDVAFTSYEREFSSPYYSIRARDLRARCAAAFGARVLYSTEAVAIDERGVSLPDGTRLDATLVVDGRGLAPGDQLQNCGYQKFLGLNLTLAEPHGLCRPQLMDATVDQRYGYRFMYVLPWSSRDLMVEDTYYSDAADLDVPGLRLGIESYCASKNWVISSETGSESGVLPIPFAGSPAPGMQRGVLAAGVRSGRFHPTTGYSVMAAVRVATQLAAAAAFNPALADRLNEESRRCWNQGDFFRRLNNMLFKAADPSDRWKIMELFYRRDPKLIERFYSGRITLADQLKLLSGKPPVPLLRGLRAFNHRIAAGDDRLA